MKYLKMFESFDFFHKIRNDDIPYREIEDINEGIKSIIERRLKHNSTLTYSIYQPYMGSNLRGNQKKLKIETDIIVTSGSPDGMVKPLMKKLITMIAQLPDEWYIVSNQTRFEGGGSWAVPKRSDIPIELYKCDQLEGLMELLKKLDIII